MAGNETGIGGGGKSDGDGRRSLMIAEKSKGVRISIGMRDHENVKPAAM